MSPVCRRQAALYPQPGRVTVLPTSSGQGGSGEGSQEVEVESEHVRDTEMGKPFRGSPVMKPPLSTCPKAGFPRQKQTEVMPSQRQTVFSICFSEPVWKQPGTKAAALFSSSSCVLLSRHLTDRWTWPVGQGLLPLWPELFFWRIATCPSLCQQQPPVS